MLKPLNDRVVIQRHNADEVSKGGIVIPSSAQEKPEVGTVLAAGPGRYNFGVFVALTVKAGDVVMFPKFGGQVIKVDGREILVLREDDLLGILV